MTAWRTGRWVIVVVAAGAVLAACSGEQGPPVAMPTPAPTWAGTATAAAPTGVAVVDRPTQPPVTPEANTIVWVESFDERTGAPKIAITTSTIDAPVLRAVLYLPSSDAPRELLASWSYNDTPMSGLDSTVQVDGGDRWVTFAISKPEAEQWIAGSYRLTVREGENVVATNAIEVLTPST